MVNEVDGTSQILLSHSCNNGIVTAENETKVDEGGASGDVKGPVCCSQRWIFAFMALWMGIMTFMLNSNMNIAIVCMVKSDTERDMTNKTVFYTSNISKHNLSYVEDVRSLTMFEENQTADVSCGEKTKTLQHSTEHAEFVWDKTTQSVVLSSYYYGYMIMQIPGGWLASKFGGKRVIGTSMLLSSGLTLLMPVLARSNVYLVVIARAIIGLCMGTTSPSLCGLIGVWALPEERSRMLGMCWFGQNLGAIIGYSTSGLLCVHGFDNGWASIFYIQGVTAAIFVGSWYFIVHSSPHSHPRITLAEKQLLARHTGVLLKQERKTPKVPWKSIFTYIPVYIAFIAHVCDTCTFYLLVICLPLYLKEVLRFEIQSNGFFSCLPYMTFMAGIAFSGMFADLLRARQRFSITTIRKVLQLASYIGIAVFIVIPGYMTCEYRYGVIACLCLCTFFEAIGITGGHLPNILDIAPRYSPIIFGVSNTIATIPGIVAPMVVGAIARHGTSEEWRMIFFIAAGIAVFAVFVYGFFANSELAPWAVQESDKIEIEVCVTREPVTDTLVPSAL